MISSKLSWPCLVSLLIPVTVSFYTWWKLAISDCCRYFPLGTAVLLFNWLPLTLCSLLASLTHLTTRCLRRAQNLSQQPTISGNGLNQLWRHQTLHGWLLLDTTLCGQWQSTDQRKTWSRISNHCWRSTMSQRKERFCEACLCMRNTFYSAERLNWVHSVGISRTPEIGWVAQLVHCKDNTFQ